MRELPSLMRRVLDQKDAIFQSARAYRYASNFLYLGRGFNFPVALEGALKLKEISYIHAEGYPAAEMKHGPIALIDQFMPVVVIAPCNDPNAEKLQSNIEEVLARGGSVIAISDETKNEDLERKCEYVVHVPNTEEFLMPLLTVIPLQLMSYYIAICASATSTSRVTSPSRSPSSEPAPRAAKGAVVFAFRGGPPSPPPRLVLEGAGLGGGERGVSPVLGLRGARGSDVCEVLEVSRQLACPILSLHSNFSVLQ